MRSSLYRLVWALGFALTLAPGCVIDTQPQPEIEDRSPDERSDDADAPPMSGGVSESFNGSQLFHSGDVDGGSPRLIVGLPGTVADSATTVHLSNVTRPDAGTLSKAPASDGSFNASFDAEAGETVRLALVPADAAEGTPPIDVVSVVLFGATDAVVSASSDVAAAIGDLGGSAASVPNGNGFTTLALPWGSVAPGRSFVVANVTAGATATGVSAADGSLSISVEAVSGDQLELFAIDSAMSNGGGPAVTVTVP